MRKLFLFALLLPCLASAEVHVSQYGVGKTFDFKLYSTDGTLDVDEADGGSEVQLSCDEGADTEATNDFVDRGNYYSIALTAAEMECARIAVSVEATDTEVFFIETTGCHSAMHSEGSVRCGDAQAGASTTITLDASASATDDAYRYHYIDLVDGTGAGQRRLITAYNGTSKVATVNRAWVTNPASGTLFNVVLSDVAFISADDNGTADANMVELDGHAINCDGGGSQPDGCGP